MICHKTQTNKLLLLLSLLPLLLLLLLLLLLQYFVFFLSSGGWRWLFSDSLILIFLFFFFSLSLRFLPLIYKTFLVWHTIPRLHTRYEVNCYSTSGRNWCFMHYLEFTKHWWVRQRFHIAHGTCCSKVVTHLKTKQAYR